MGSMELFTKVNYRQTWQVTTVWQAFQNCAMNKTSKLTFAISNGALNSFPPCKRKPQGEPPCRWTSKVSEAIFLCNLSPSFLIKFHNFSYTMLVWFINSANVKQATRPSRITRNTTRRQLTNQNVGNFSRVIRKCRTKES